MSRADLREIACSGDNPMDDGTLRDTLKSSALLNLKAGATPEAIKSSLRNLRELATERGIVP